MYKNGVQFIDLGLIPFGNAWERQKELHHNTLKSSNNGATTDAGYLVFCEHPHVITLGLHANESNLLIPDQLLKKKRVELYRTDRGGDITYHGPGQLVVYPVFNLFMLKLGVKEYVSRLEEVVIVTLKDLGISSSRLPGASGVWIEPETQHKARKICAVGVKVSRGISMHGIAFNINTDLAYFNLINPCGFTDKGVTSVALETSHPADMNRIKKLMLQHLSDIFSIRITQ